jgi:DNA-binding NtrC family response regulator
LVETHANPIVLIVDDEPLIREGLRFAFELEGYTVRTAEGGNEAFRILQSEPVDFVLSDVRMPAGSGSELLQKARGLDPSPPIVLMTGYADLSRGQALALGAVELVRKPYDLDQLYRLARQHTQS